MNITMNYISGFIFLIIISILTIIKSKNSISNNKYSNTQRVTYIGVFTALGFILMLIPFPPFILPFLKIELSILSVIIIYKLIDYKSAAITSIVLSILLYLLNGSQVGIPIDQMAYLIASLSFIFILDIMINLLKDTDYKIKHIISLIISTIITTVVMILLNYLFITPIYIDLYTSDGFYGWLEIEEPNNFFLWILSIYGPFNLVKYGANSIIAIIMLLSLKQVLEE